MADSIITTPNMGLKVPAAGVTPGPEWFQAIVQSLLVIDQHNHSGPPGEGVPIGSNGISLTGDLPFNGFGAVGITYVQFTPQASALLDTLYVQGVDLYYNDGNGNVVQITSGGVINATSSGISSGTATASFVSSVLVVNAAANTPANIQVASIRLGNNSAGTHYVTISPTNSLAADYQLFLPATLPGSTGFLTLDSSGNIALATSVQPTQIAAGSITTAQLAPLGQQISSSSEAFTSGTAAFVVVNNLSVTITTSGRPIRVSLQPDANASTPNASFLENSSGAAFMKFVRGSTVVGQYPMPTVAMPTSLMCLDAQPAGTYTYTFQVNAPSGTSIVNHAVLVALEE